MKHANTNSKSRPFRGSDTVARPRGAVEAEKSRLRTAKPSKFHPRARPARWHRSVFEMSQKSNFRNRAVVERAGVHYRPIVTGDPS